MIKKIKSLIVFLLLLCLSAPSSAVQTVAMPKTLTYMVNQFSTMKSTVTMEANASPSYLKGLEKRLDPKAVHISNIVDTFKWTRYRNAVTGKVIKYQYRLKYRITASQERQAQKKISQIASSAKKIKDKKSRAKYIYGKVISGTKYSSSSQACFTAYGALIKKRACCQGLSDAFALICQKAGLNAQIISGTSTANADVEAHMWTRVYIGGKWLYCDPTWDLKRHPYKFFLKSYTYFRKSGHIPTK